MLRLIISTESHHDPIIHRLTGIQPSSAVAVIDEHQKTGHLYLDSRYTSRTITPRPGWTVTKHDRGTGREFLREQGSTYTISPHCSIQTKQSLETIGFEITVDKTDWGSEQRTIKSHDELLVMKEGYRGALEVFERIRHKSPLAPLGERGESMNDCSPSFPKRGLGGDSLSLRASLIQHAFSLGFTGEAFETIVATGVQTASPHHHTDMTPIGPGPLLIDMGWKWQGYCTDTTRCYRVGEQSGADYQAWSKIYQIVQDAKDRCIQQATLGMTGQQIDSIARDWIEQSDYGQWFTTKHSQQYGASYTPDQKNHNRQHTAAPSGFTHSTGHGIGLEVHERPWVSPSDRGDEKILPGMVITIEPGIYLPEKFGVRLEDTYVMTTGGLVRMDQYTQRVVNSEKLKIKN